MHNDNVLVPAVITEGGTRYYSDEQLLEYLNRDNLPKQLPIILYARVSTRNQKDDLERQVENLKQYAIAKGYLFEAIAEQSFYKFTSILKYKCEWNNIELLKVDRFYPSSKLCSCCGNIKKDLRLKDRTYNCNICGLIINRDFNASLNLANYKLA